MIQYFQGIRIMLRDLPSLIPTVSQPNQAVCGLQVINPGDLKSLRLCEYVDNQSISKCAFSILSHAAAQIESW